MMDPSAGTPLEGGRVTPGVVRIADTVRRPPSANSRFVGMLLSHLQRAGFTGAPRFLGADELGRDVLSYIEGQVPRELSWHEDEVLADAARLIRQYHDATADLVGSQAAREAGLEIVCHNDLSPCNFVFRDGRPVAIIDFDSASPGTRLHDLGYAAWLWLDLGNEEIEVDLQRRRLAGFCRAYDPLLGPDSIAEAIILRQRILAADGQRRGNNAMATWAAACLDWSIRYLRIEIRVPQARSPD